VGDYLFRNNKGEKEQEKKQNSKRKKTIQEFELDNKQD